MGMAGNDEAVTVPAQGAPSAGAGVLASLAACMLLPSLGTSIANVALPTLAVAFGASFQEVQWVVLAYLLAITTTIVSVGRLGDVMGRTRLLAIGILLFTAASGLGGLATDLWLLIAARAVQGVGAAVLMALSMALVGEVVPKERAGVAMGLLGTMSALGTALGPTLGGVLIASFGWPAIFLVNLPLGIVALVLVRSCLPASRPASGIPGVRFDHAGTLLLALTLAAYALAVTMGRGAFTWLNAALLGAAALGAGFFLRIEARAASPLINLATFRDPVLGASLVTSALVSTVMMATLVVGPFHLDRALGLDTALVGIVMSAGPVMAALAGVPAGRSVDRFGGQRMTVAGLAGMAVGCSALAAMPPALGIAGYVIPMGVLTASYALFQAANNTVVMRDVPASQRGAVSGLLNLSRNLGLITGTAVMGAVFAWASGASDVTTAHPAAVARAMGVTFAVATVLVIVALAVAFGSRKLPRFAHGSRA